MSSRKKQRRSSPTGEQTVLPAAPPVTQVTPMVGVIGAVPTWYPPSTTATTTAATTTTTTATTTLTTPRTPSTATARRQAAAAAAPRPPPPARTTARTYQPRVSPPIARPTSGAARPSPPRLFRPSTETARATTRVTAVTPRVSPTRPLSPTPKAAYSPLRTTQPTGPPTAPTAFRASSGATRRTAPTPTAPPRSATLPPRPAPAARGATSASTAFARTTAGPNAPRPLAPPRRLPSAATEAAAAGTTAEPTPTPLEIDTIPLPVVRRRGAAPSATASAAVTGGGPSPAATYRGRRPSDRQVAPLLRLLMHSTSDEGDRALAGILQSWPELGDALLDYSERVRAEIGSACATAASPEDRDALERLSEAFGTIEPEGELGTNASCLELARLASRNRLALVFPYSVVETYPLFRSYWSAQVVAELDGAGAIAPPGCGEAGRALVVERRLASGAGGESWSVHLASDAGVPRPYPIVLRTATRVGFDRERLIAASATRDFANDSVRLSMCPNFTMTYRACYRPAAEGVADEVDETLVYEAADFDLGVLSATAGALSEDADYFTLFSIVIQVMMALVALSYAEVSHNALLLSNVLANRVEEVWYVYEALGRRYPVPTRGILAKVSNVEAASSPRLGIPHPRVPIEGVGGVRDEESAPARLPHYARDILVFFQQLASVVEPKHPASGIQEAVRGWIIAAHAYIARVITGSEGVDPGILDTPKGLQDLVASLLDNEVVRAIFATQGVPPPGTRFVTCRVDAIPAYLSAGTTSAGTSIAAGRP